MTVNYSKEDLKIGNGILREALADELRSTGCLMKNCGDSSSGSESAPSDDNLQPEEIIKIIPVIDKKTKKDLEKKKLNRSPSPLKDNPKRQQLKKSESRANIQRKQPGEKSVARLPIIDFDPKRGESPSPIKE